MFQSALYSKPPVLTAEEINIGIEKSFEELDKATALVERLTLARESFNAIPAENMSQKLVTLFATNFIDVPSHLVPETSSKALESAQRASGKELKAFALESGDGVISKIIEFIKSVCRRIRDFFKSLFEKLTKKSGPTINIDYSKIVNAEITPTEDFAVFVKSGRIFVETINDTIHSMVDVSKSLLRISNDIKASAKTFKTGPDDLLNIFRLKQIPLNPICDWPGQVFFHLDDSSMEASLVFPEPKPERPKLTEKILVSKTTSVFISNMIGSMQLSRKHLAESVKSLDVAVEIIEKEAEALAKSRNVSSNRSSGDVVDVIGVNTPREDEKSPLAMKMFVKVVGTFSKGVAGVSVRFIEHELRAVESIERQLSTKAA